MVGLAKAAVRRFIFYRYKQFVMALSLEDPIPEIQCSRDITIRMATLADVDELYQSITKHKEWPSDWLRTRKQLSEWIAKGYPFFLAAAEDKTIGYTCVLLEVPSRHPILGKSIDFKDGDAWGGDAFVLSRYRGRRIFPALAVEAMKCAKAAGYRRILADVSPNNSAARSAHRKIGYTDMKLVTSARILFYKRTNVKSLQESVVDGQNSQRI